MYSGQLNRWKRLEACRFLWSPQQPPTSRLSRQSAGHDDEERVTLWSLITLLWLRRAAERSFCSETSSPGRRDPTGGSPAEGIGSGKMIYEMGNHRNHLITNQYPAPTSRRVGASFNVQVSTEIREDFGKFLPVLELEFYDDGEIY